MRKNVFSMLQIRKDSRHSSLDTFLCKGVPLTAGPHHSSYAHSYHRFEGHGQTIPGVHRGMAGKMAQQAQ